MSAQQLSPGLVAKCPDMDSPASFPSRTFPPPLQLHLLCSGKPPTPTQDHRAFGLYFLSLQWSNLPFPLLACRNFLVVSGREGAFCLQNPPVAYLPGACTMSASCFSSPPPLNVHGDLSSGLLQIRKRPKTQENREMTMLPLATTGCSCFSNREVQVTLGYDHRVHAAKTQ